MAYKSMTSTHRFTVQKARRPQGRERPSDVTFQGSHRVNEQMYLSRGSPTEFLLLVGAGSIQ